MVERHIDDGSALRPATARDALVPVHDEQRRLILLAEDDDDQRAALAAFLDLLGYDVIAVASGSELLDALALIDDTVTARPDLIITDIMMPGMTGLSIVEELRAGGWTEPVIIITGFDWPDRVERVAGLDDVRLLTKPYDPSELARVIEALMHPAAVH